MTLDETQRQLANILEPLGFEVHPFKIGWYNAKVEFKFKLPFAEDVLAFVVVSRPDMFEKAFLPYLKANAKEFLSNGLATGDPLDKCMKETLNKSVDTFDEVEVMHDFEIGPNRRPRVLVQTAAHVAGAVRFFQAGDVVDQTSLNDILSSKIYPVCIHPKFGGWFAIRGVIIFKQLRCPELKQSQCSLDLCQSDIVKLLKLYNDSWRDWRFRDIIKTDQRYSDLQMQYFETPPDQRESIIREICSSHHHQ